MKFSILVPVYNVEKYVEECIESVLKQDFSDFELILVDDGSTDRSGEICDRYCAKNPGIIRVIHKNNKGLLLARRTGIQAAKGEYFVFLDSDDYFFPGALSAIDAAIERYSADMVLYDYYKEQTQSIIRLFPDVNECVFTKKNKDVIYSQLLTGAYLNAMWIRAVKRTVVDIEKDYSEYARISMGEDFVQVLPLYTKAERIAYISQALIFYRKNQNGLTSLWKADYFYSYQKSAPIVESYLPLWSIDSKAIENYYCLLVKTVCDFLECAYSESFSKFNEIYQALLCDDYLMRMIDSNSGNCVQAKHRIYGRLIKKRCYLALKVFTGIVVKVIQVKKNSIH